MPEKRYNSGTIATQRAEVTVPRQHRFVPSDAVNRRWVRRTAVGVALVAGLAACGDESSPEERVAKRLDEALTAHAEGRIDEAVEGYENVLEDEPGNQYAHYNLGLVYQQAGE